MAIYHFSGQILGRKSKRNPDGSYRPGSNAVAAAAYRAGERLTDRNTREVHDYSRRGGVAHAEILAPPGSAPWLTDRETLWNTVEAMEIRKDAQLAREFNMALPHELNPDDRLELVRTFLETHFVRRGMVADFALHDPVPEHGQSEKNFHAHVLLTLRRATASGLDPVKTRQWNSKELLNLWRAEWAIACNAALERAGQRMRIDHRTLEAQRKDALTRRDLARALELNRTPEIHVGPKARQIVRSGRTPVSQIREVNAYRQRTPATPETKTQRRRRDYPSYDKGMRLSWLEQIVAGNNVQLKRDLMAINRRFDRMSRKLDYWQRRTTFKTEGTIKGPKFRFNRWKAAQEDKQRRDEAVRKVAHARKRLEQITQLLKGLERAATGANRRYEHGLIRAKEVERWVRRIRHGDRAASRRRERWQP
ncbi:MobA/MobL family protein [Agrobacterium tumefaciens]|uniref:MobQ family relaxase n=1 Tax=Agrobacterium tumefaciens TaxID=358 RepID=UPI0021D37212|nr:MobQ family relaxase [Agrobacterium tumefaciens]UXT50152.1 MobA/MobL family protein [Agrobacterium tumefaciens]